VKKPYINKWTIAAMFAVVQFGAYGTTQGCLGLFIKPIEYDTGWSRTAISFVPSILLAANFTASIWWGLLADKWSIKGVLILSGLCLSIGFLVSSTSSTITLIYVFLGVIGGIGVGGSAGPLSGLAARWFQDQKAFGIGLGYSGVSIGTVLLPFIVSPVINQYGWRSAFVLLGSVALFCFWSAGLILREPRNGNAISADTLEKRKIESDHAVKLLRPQTSLSTAIRSSDFWILFLMHILGVFVLQMTVIHMVPDAIEHGISSNQATFLLPLVGVLSILGKIGGGRLGDKVGNRKMLLFAFLLQSTTLIFINTFDSLWAYYLFAALFGLTYGTWSPQIPAIAGNTFGAKNLGAIMGGIMPSGAIGGFVGPAFAGILFDHFGNYTFAFYVGAAVCIITAILPSLITQKSRSAKQIKAS